MSVASEFPPEVVIPQRARRTMPGGRDQARHLTLVPGTGAPRALERPAGRRRTTMPSRGAQANLTEQLCFGQSRLAWPLTVSPADRPMRLTRRGLVVAIAATVLLGALLLLTARLSAGSAPNAPALPAGSTVTVQSGDTLWSIAQRAEPHSDPRLVVDHLRQVNHLNSVVLSPGQTLKLG
ncbi:MAG: LysM peptidoglycan-binding domain-containing protein [Jatrophihabitantaceae bacterium]